MPDTPKLTDAEAALLAFCSQRVEGLRDLEDGLHQRGLTTIMGFITDLGIAALKAAGAET